MRKPHLHEHILEFSFDFQGIFELDDIINQRTDNLRMNLQVLNKTFCLHFIQNLYAGMHK